MYRAAFVLALLVPVLASAQEPSGNYEHLQDLEMMIGKWVSDGDIAGSVTFGWALNKNVVEMKADLRMNGGGTYQRHTTYYWDPEDETIKAAGFDSQGAHAHITVKVDGDKLVQQGKVHLPNGETAPANSEIAFTEDECHVTVKGPDGDMTIHFKRGD